ncbi:Ribosomal protein arginine N-methyltransferase rmt3 [Podospora pseudocomata]|uniref:type I protein arginine methyltransferase n=1 Tax=Podospora pseudocomata TaxID=2093779 RepID=A0ABR0GJF8_9PEZI|nr:Ribosomal protein arginine N-methyltransferase rmt3 [Podospora pseudocomata]
MAEAYPPSISDGSSSDNSEAGNWLQGDQDDGDDFSEQETVQVISLMDDKVFDDALAMVTYCKEKYGLDFLGVRDRLGLDFYGSIKLINFIRQKVHDGKPVKPDDIKASDLEDDSLLKPVLEDDALIVCLDDLPAAGEAAPQAREIKQNEVPAVDELLRKNAQLQEELEKLSQQFSNYRLAVQQTLDQRWGEDDKPGSSKARAEAPAPAPAPATNGTEKKDNSPPEATYYFESYAHNDIHETMLKDTIRTNAYRDFIYNNKAIFAGKTVLDIGCGTGILSMFAAKAGAAKVLAVDNSAIIDKARENIFNNGLDNVITCIRGKIEEVTLPVPTVDIIVSEWMGYCLLYEAMLPSVLYARDKYLKPDTGLLVPSHTSMWIAPVADEEYVTDNMDFWRDVYGFDMKAMQEGTYANCRIEHLPDAAVAGTAQCFRMLDLHTCTKEDLVFNEKWTSTYTSKDKLDGFLVWFDTFFCESRQEQVEKQLTWKQWMDVKGKESVAFTTGPFDKETHWRQGLMLIDHAKQPKGSEEKVKEGARLEGEIEYAIPEGHHRGLNIKVTWGLEGEEGEKRLSQMWMCH